MQDLIDPPSPGWPTVAILDTTDPLLGGPGGALNRGVEALAERTVRLRRDLLETTGRLAIVEQTGVAAMSRAIPLGWVYGADRLQFELFAPGYTLRDDVAVRRVTGTVAGDDSVDLDSTVGLAPGRSYVIWGDGGTQPEVVTVAQVLTATRIRATAALTVTRGLGSLGTTSFRVGDDGRAYAGPGAVYFSGRVDAFVPAGEGRVIVRRDTEAGTVTLRWRPSGSGAWQAATRGQTVQRAPGTRDEDWIVPGGAAVQLRLDVDTVVGTEVAIHHVALAAVAQAAATLVDRPRVTTPTAGAAGLTTTPTIGLSPYRSLYGVAHDATEVQVGLDPAFAAPVWAPVLGPVTQATPPAGALTTNTVYHVRARYRDADGVWSPWSPSVSFATGAVAAWVQQPSLTAPASGATGVGLRPTLTANAFAVFGGTDTHQTSRWQIGTDSGFASIVHDSGSVGGGSRTTYTLPVDLAPLTDYWVRVQYTGQALGASAWSPPVRMTTGSQPAAPTVTAPASGASAVPLVPTIAWTGFVVVGQQDAFVEARVQIARATDPDFTAPVVDTTVGAVTQWQVPGANALQAQTQHLVRVRHRGLLTGWGPWSNAVNFTSDQPSGSVAFATPGRHTWTVPPNVYLLRRLRALGAGGGHSFVVNLNGPDHFPGGAGGAGGYAEDEQVAVQPGQQIEIVIGEGGRSQERFSGDNGGTTSIGTLISATGGRGGGSRDSGGAGGAGGQGIGGRRRVPGGPGGSMTDGMLPGAPGALADIPVNHAHGWGGTLRTDFPGHLRSWGGAHGWARIDW